MHHKRFSRHILRNRRWPALRVATLRRDGFRCVSCGARGRLEVDHIKPVRMHPELAFELTNLQALCSACHSRKTRLECGFDPPSKDRIDWRNAVTELSNRRKSCSQA